MLLILSSFAACSSGDGEAADGDGVNAGQVDENDDQTGSEDSDTPEDEDETGDEGAGGQEDADKDDDGSQEKDDADKAENAGSGSGSSNGSSGASSGNTGSSKPSSGSGSTSGGSGSGSSSGSGSNSGSGSGSNSGSKPSGSDKDTASAPKGTPSEIIEKIYGEKSVDLSLVTSEVDLSNGDMAKSITGLSSMDKVKAAAYSESMLGAQAYSLVVVRVKDSKDAESVANSMLSGIDPRKWICVEADDVRVAAKGDLVMLFMVDSQYSDTVTGKEMVSAFKSVCGGSLDVSLKK